MPRSPDAKPAKTPKAEGPVKAAPAKAKPVKPPVVKPPVVKPETAGPAAGKTAPTKAEVAAKPAGAPGAAAKAAKGGAKGKSSPSLAATGVKLRDLVDRVTTATGGKKTDVKATVEATLAALAAALKDGSDLTLPPLGKLRVVKLAQKDGAIVMTLKLRHGGGSGQPGAKPLAEDGEDG